MDEQTDRQTVGMDSSVEDCHVLVRSRRPPIRRRLDAFNHSNTHRSSPAWNHIGLSCQAARAATDGEVADTSNVELRLVPIPRCGQLAFGNRWDALLHRLSFNQLITVLPTACLMNIFGRSFVGKCLFNEQQYSLHFCAFRQSARF